MFGVFNACVWSVSRRHSEPMEADRCSIIQNTHHIGCCGEKERERCAGSDWWLVPSLSRMLRLDQATSFSYVSSCFFFPSLFFPSPSTSISHLPFLLCSQHDILVHFISIRIWWAKWRGKWKIKDKLKALENPMKITNLVPPMSKRRSEWACRHHGRSLKRHQFSDHRHVTSKNGRIVGEGRCEPRTFKIRLCCLKKLLI